MHGTMTESLGVMAALTEPQARIVEVVEVNTIQVVSMVVNYIDKVAQFALAFGGTSAAGIFHMDHDRRDMLASVTIANPDFDRLFLVTGNPKRELTQQFLDDLFISILIPTANDRVWNIPGLEVSMDGSVVYKRTIPPDDNPHTTPPAE